MEELKMAQKIHKSIFLLLLLYSKGKSGDLNEKITGITKLEKLLFLVKEEVLKKHKLPFEEDYYVFRPYNYGPFTEELFDDIELLSDLGFLPKTDERENDDFVLTSEGAQKASEIKDLLPNDIVAGIENIKKNYADRSLNNLLEYVYTKYPDYTLKSQIKDKILG